MVPGGIIYGMLRYKELFTLYIRTNAKGNFYGRYNVLENDKQTKVTAVHHNKVTQRENGPMRLLWLSWSCRTHFPAGA